MEQNTAPKKSKKGLIIALAVLFVLLVAGGVAAAIIIPNINALDVTKYVTVEFAGRYETNSEAVAVLDYVKLAKDLEFEEMKDIKKFRELEAEGAVSLAEFSSSKSAKKAVEEEYGLDLEELYELTRAVKISVKGGSEGLKNGEKITVTIKTENNPPFKHRLKGGTIIAKVKGLEQLQELTLDLYCEYEGLSGSGRLTVSFRGGIPFWLTSYELSEIPNNGSLSNGDTFTLTFKVLNYEETRAAAVEEGFDLKETYTFNVTVNELDQPLGVNDLDYATVLKYMEMAKADLFDHSNEYYAPYKAYFIKYNSEYRRDELVIYFLDTRSNQPVIYNYVFISPYRDKDGELGRYNRYRPSNFLTESEFYVATPLPVNAYGGYEIVY